MFLNKGKKSTDQSNLSSSNQHIADPWQHSSPEPKTNSTSEAWNFTPEATPLISPAGKPGVPKLPSHQPTSEEILLEDELKLKTSPSNFLKQQLEKALALLFWNK